MKKFYEQYRIGSTKYSVHFHNGTKTHRDGSEFYDIRLFSNRKKKDEFICDLMAKGYVEAPKSVA